MTARGPREPSAVSLLSVVRSRDGVLEVSGRSWQEDGSLSARYRSEAVKELKQPSGVFYYWKGERPRDPNAPQIDGFGEIRLDSSDRANGYWTTQLPNETIRTSGVYLRAAVEDIHTLERGDDAQRAELIGERLRHWKSLTNV
jgi:hypothetical protein